jgi:glycosyltransferase involved in cell wall biosynthesis
VISVILTTYERRGLLARALASVLAQTVTDREVIVVDDGSTDGTAEFLGEQTVTSIRIAHSGNPGVVRNAGLAQARGEFITVLDSDDVWQPTALAELAQALSQHSDAGFAYCDYQPHPPPSPPKSAGASDVFDRLLQTDFLVTGGVLIRRSLAEAVGGFDPRCSPAEDWDFWLRMAARARGANVPVSLITIDSPPDSLSRAPGGAIYAANVRVLRKALGWCLTNRPASVGLARECLRRNLLASARYHRRHRAFGRSMRDLVMVARGR